MFIEVLCHEALLASLTARSQFSRLATFARKTESKSTLHQGFWVEPLPFGSKIENKILFLIHSDMVSIGWVIVKSL